MSGYAKLMSSILHSTIWLEPDHVRIVWITMLAMANRNGVVEASMPGLAVAARVSLPQCEEAIERFLSPDPHSRTKDYEGRRIEEVDGGWVLLNYAKHREVVSRSKKSERQSKWRAGVKAKAKAALDVANAVEANDIVADGVSPDRCVDDVDIKRVSETSTAGSGSGSFTYNSDPDPDLPDRSDLSEVATRYAEDECSGRMEFQPADTWPEVRRVADAWKAVWGREVVFRGGLRDARLRALLARLSEGYSSEDLCRAISGSKRDDFTNRTPNARQMASVLRDASTVDKFIELLDEPDAEQEPAKPGGMKSLLDSIEVEP